MLGDQQADIESILCKHIANSSSWSASLKKSARKKTTHTLFLSTRPSLSSLTTITTRINPLKDTSVVSSHGIQQVRSDRLLQRRKFKLFSDSDYRIARIGHKEVERNNVYISCEIKLFCNFNLFEEDPRGRFHGSIRRAHEACGARRKKAVVTSSWLSRKRPFRA